MFSFKTPYIHDWKAYRKVYAISDKVTFSHTHTKEKQKNHADGVKLVKLKNPLKKTLLQQ